MTLIEEIFICRNLQNVTYEPVEILDVGEMYEGEIRVDFVMSCLPCCAQLTKE